MKNKIELGHTYKLNVIKLKEFGAYLDAGELGEVLLPRKYMPKNLSTEDSVDVFLYQDSEGRTTATTQQPKASVGEFAYLPVVSVSEVGAFLDWGLAKDLFVPFAEQHRRMEVGHSYIVYIYLGKHDGRITASSKIDKFVADEAEHQFTPKQVVKLIIANSTDLGFKAIINHNHWGVLFKNEVHQRLSFGQSIDGFIKRIRPDGKIDLSLHSGQQSRDRHAQTILDYLEKQKGFAPVHDKTDPKLIARLFHMSKGAFKKSIGGLYKQRVIRIEKDGIYLVDSSQNTDS